MISLILGYLIVCGGGGVHCMEFESSLYPVHDGVDRLAALTDGTFSTRVGADTWLVWFKTGATESKVDAVHEYTLQVGQASPPHPHG